MMVKTDLNQIIEPMVFNGCPITSTAKSNINNVLAMSVPLACVSCANCAHLNCIKPKFFNDTL